MSDLMLYFVVSPVVKQTGRRSLMDGRSIMGSGWKILERVLVLVVIAGFMAVPCKGAAGELKVQSGVNHGAAVDGASGIGAPVLIHVVVTAGGQPVINLGDTVGDGTAEINIPTPWTLRTVSTPSGGCILAPTQFVNGGKGLYTIVVVPPLSNPTGCAWVAGDYVYAVQIDKRKLGGTALGVLTIPAATQ
jgi:hypothetical protein